MADIAGSRIALRLIRIAVASVFVAAIAAPARAHVTIQPASAMVSSTIDLAFRVPSERPRAATIGLIVQFPPLVHVALAQMPPGWHAHVTMRRLAKPLYGPSGAVASVVDTIAWTGGRINPKGYALFHILVGPLPAYKVLVFKANQTYSNGEIVRWIETQFPGQAAPQRPAPMLRLVAR